MSNVITCDGVWQQGANGIECIGTLISVPHVDIQLLFEDYLAPDPELIGQVSGIALTFFVIGVGAGRVVQILRKV